MKRNKEGWILVIWLSLTVMHVETLSAQKSWNWFEAKKLCEQNNDSLPTPRTISSKAGKHWYWSDQYRRYSFWIKILGCYNDTSSDDTENFPMYVPSAGFCQEICATRNSSIFGINEKECKCFKNLPLGQPVSSNYCDAVHQTTDEIRFAEHGSTNTYTLYESDFKVRKKDEVYCVAVQCVGHKRFYFEPFANCSFSYGVVCQKPVSNSYQNWTSSMDICKTESYSYLAGNVSLNDIEQTCDRLNVSLTGPLWLGVAKEVYIGYDRGMPVNTEERTSFLQCGQCYGNECGYFEGCTSTQNTVTTVYCEKGFNTSTSDPVTTTDRNQTDISTQTLEPVTNKPGTWQSVTHTLESSTNLINFISTNSFVNHPSERDVTNSSNTLSIILPLVVALIIIGGLVMAAVFYIRRKRGQGNHNAHNAKPLDSRCTENGYTDIDIDVKNKNYFVLEQKSETNDSKSHVNYTYDSNPYTYTAEGVYDHLRDKESRKRREEDETLRDSNPYKDIAEGIYDHLKDKESRKINKGGGKVMDSNPYKETEGGVYDHLREKETGKSTEENNYDHTPATTGKEYCAHGGTDEDTADTDYDHAMSFYNYKQHDQVLEETDGGYAKTVNIS